MPFARGSNVSATQATALYGVLEGLLTAAGWVQDAATSGAPIVYNNLNWHIWRNPAANSGIAKDFHVAIGYATSGTGSIYFRLFEDWLGLSADPTVDKYEWGCTRPVPASPVPGPGAGWELGAHTDAWGRDFADPSTYSYSNQTSFKPAPSSTGFDWPRADSTGYYDSGELNPAVVPNPDFSVGFYGNHYGGRFYYGFNGSADLQNQAAPIAMDFRSHYVAELEFMVDDETAVEYVFFVSSKAINVAAYRVFNNAVTARFIGAYEEYSPHDPCPIMLRGMGFGKMTSAFTRYWGYADQPTDPGTINFLGVSDYFASNSLKFLTDIEGQPTTNPAGKSIAIFSIPFKAATSSRIGINGATDSEFRGVFPLDMVATRMPVQADTPPIDFGDEALINGIPYVHVYIQVYGRVSAIADASPSSTYYWAVWMRRD